LHQSLNFRPGEVLEEGFLSEDARPGGTYKTLAEQREVLTPGVGPNAEDTPDDIVFADPVIFLFLGAFVLAKAMITHGLDRRFSFLAARGGTLDLRCDYRLRRHRGSHKHPRYGGPDPSLTEPCG
jgi:hypothetical protein